jgi:hypothetical protein
MVVRVAAGPRGHNGLQDVSVVCGRVGVALLSRSCCSWDFACFSTSLSACVGRLAQISSCKRHSLHSSRVSRSFRPCLNTSDVSQAFLFGPRRSSSRPSSRSRCHCVADSAHRVRIQTAFHSRASATLCVCDDDISMPVVCRTCPRSRRGRCDLLCAFAFVRGVAALFACSTQLIRAMSHVCRRADVARLGSVGRPSRQHACVRVWSR